MINDLKEKLEIKTKEHSAVMAENSLLTEKIKEQNQDISYYHKTVTDLQSKMIEKMNDAAQLYEEAKELKKENILKKHNEFGMSESGLSFGIDLSAVNDNYFNVPSRTRHKIFAHSKEATWLSYSSNGTGLATGGGDGSIKIWDVDQGKEIGNLTKQKRPISCLWFTPDDQFLVTCSLDRSIKIWKIQTLRDAISFSGHSDTINACAFSYAAKCLVTGSSDRTIRLWDYGKGVSTKTFPCTSSCFTLDTLPTETDIVSGHLDGSLRFWWAKNEEKIHEMKEVHSDSISSVTLTLDGNYVLTNSRDHTLKLIDVRKYEEVCCFEHDLYINGTNTNKATLNSKGNYGAVGSKQGNIIIFEIKGDKMQIEEIYQGNHSSCINGIEWQPCASSFSSIDASGSLLIWE